MLFDETPPPYSEQEENTSQEISPPAYQRQIPTPQEVFPPAYERQAPNPQEISSPTNERPIFFPVYRNLEARRLHQILLYCLAIDYGVEDILAPNPAERKFFVNLYRGLSLHLDYYNYFPLWELRNAPPPPKPNAEYIKYILEPSKALGIPERKVLQRLHALAKSWAGDYDYIGAWKFVGYHAATSLKDKFLDDRNILIKALVPSTERSLRQRLLNDLQKKQSEFFEYLYNRNSYALTPLGKNLEARQNIRVNGLGFRSSIRTVFVAIAFPYSSHQIVDQNIFSDKARDWTTQRWNRGREWIRGLKQTKARPFRKCQGDLDTKAGLY